ncbi:MAG: hypothetical protein LUD68_04780 [Rikenellaceae bacterium]|nr:hypothetical protein [Rikenellaceae bacterium]
MVLVKSVTHLLPAKYYLIVTEEFTMIRKVAAYKKPEEVLLCTTEREGYDVF